MPFHPVIVHFAVALLPVAVLADLWIRLRPVPECRGGVHLIWFLASVAAVLAAVSGQSELDGYRLPPRLDSSATVHETTGSITAWLAAAALLARLAERWWARRPAGRPAGSKGDAAGNRRVPVHSILVISLGLAAAVMALVAGGLGGQLVHRHGLTRAAVPWDSEEGSAEPFRMDPAPDNVDR